MELTQTGASDPKWTFPYFESNGTDVNHSISLLFQLESFLLVIIIFRLMNILLIYLVQLAPLQLSQFPMRVSVGFLPPGLVYFMIREKIGFIIIGWDGFIRTLQRLTTRTGFGLRAVVGYGPIKNHFLIYFVMILLIGSISICPQKMELLLRL